MYRTIFWREICDDKAGVVCKIYNSFVTADRLGNLKKSFSVWEINNG